ncbi:hypothetical protein QE152_g792 [Popillia japonica]|uniref:Uncharacterized protein n=1 Tax=Popillia japonica TaxID=7064 RepID=A0AAW1NA26_POPJA
MAGRGSSQTGAAKNAVSLRTVETPETLQKGEKFIKWEEMGAPANIKIKRTSPVCAITLRTSTLKLNGTFLPLPTAKDLAMAYVEP